MGFRRKEKPLSASDYIQQIRASIGPMPLMMPSVAAVILNAKHELLLQQKADQTWSLPAGMIEPQESPTQALIREVREETGFKVSAERLLGVFGGEGFAYTYPNGDQVMYTVLLFQCTVEGDAGTQRDDETLRLEWFAKNRLPPLALPYPTACLFAENQATYFV